MTTAESRNYARLYLKKALRDLIAVKGDVEYGTTLITLAKATPLVRRAHTLIGLANAIVRSTP